MQTPLLVVVVAIAALCVYPPPPAYADQQNVAATGTIAGTLTSADLGRPIRKAQVKLVSVPGDAAYTTFSDAEGRYLFDGVKPGDYMLSATKPGYLEMALGARRPGAGVPGRILTLAAGQRIDKVAMTLPRGSVIAGIVLDEFGDPAMGVTVRAMRLEFQNGHRTARPVGNAVTDDLGGYRIPGLLPGEFVVAAVPRDSVANASAAAESIRVRQEQVRTAGNTRPQRVPVPEAPSGTIGYVPSYFGGSPTPGGATPIRLGLEEQANGIDLQLISLKTGSVSGVVTGADGMPTLASVQLIDPLMPIAGLAVWFRHPGADGRFSFGGLVPGDYVLRAQGTKAVGEAGTGQFTAILDVHVPPGGEADGSVRLRRGVAVTGALDLAGQAPSVDVTRLRVQLVPVVGASDWEAAAPLASVNAEGRFTISPVPPGPYRVAVTGLPRGWLLASAKVGSLDAADIDLEVKGESIAGLVLRLTEKPSEVTGVVTTADNDPVRDRSVVLFPADRDQWRPAARRIQLAQPGADGRYAFRMLPAGEYRVAAVDPPESGEQFNADYLARILPDSVAITVAAGATVTQDIRVR